MKDGAKFGALDMDKRQAGLTAIVARLYSLKGMGGAAVAQKEDGTVVPSPDVQLAVTELEKECAVKYPFFTLSEIRVALEAGVKGELTDEPAYLNTANMCRWLSIYRKSAARLEAVQAIENDVRVAAPSMQLDAGTVQTRNDEAMKRLEGELLDELRTAGTFGEGRIAPVLAALYDWLRETGRMEKPAPATIQDAMRRAAQAKTDGTIRTAAQVIERAVAGVVTGAKRLLVEDYYRHKLTA